MSAKGKVSYHNAPDGSPGPAVVSLSYKEAGDSEELTLEIEGHSTVVGNEIAICRCGKTSNGDGTCDGSHQNS